jgi:exodeoxyribonuclease VII large subunit
VRAPTPSAAAEIVIAEKQQQLAHLGQMRQRFEQTLRHTLRHHRKALEGILRHPVLTSPYGILGPWMQKLDDYRHDIDSAMRQQLLRCRMLLTARQKHALTLNPTTQIVHLRQRLMQFDRSMRQAWQAQQDNRSKHLNPDQKRKLLDHLMLRILTLKKERLGQISAALRSIDPKNLLTKGYSILLAEKDGSVITSVLAVAAHQDVRVLLSDGELITTVKEIVPK